MDPRIRIKDKDKIKESDSGCSLGPIVKTKTSNLFPFIGDMDKGKFGYDGFSDNITTHGRSHLFLLRESY